MTVDQLHAAELESALDRAAEEVEGLAGPGFALTVSLGGKVVFEACRGLADVESERLITPATRFHVASLSKRFTALAIGILTLEGQVDVDAPLATYLDDLPALATTLTCRQLATHSSGLRDQWQLLVMAGWRMEDVITDGDVRWLLGRQTELNFAPGADAAYCNSGYTLLASVVEQVSGLDFVDFCRDRIFRPLGMNDTSFVRSYQEVIPGRAPSYATDASGGLRRSVLSYATVGATSLSTTITDMGTWSTLGERRFGAIDTPFSWLAEEQRFNDGSGIGYAFGLLVDEYHGHRRLHHSGVDAGYRAYYARLPELECSVTVLSNHAAVPVAAITEALLDVVVGHGSQTPAEPVPDSAAARTAEVVPGWYAATDLGLVHEVLQEGDGVSIDGVRLHPDDGGGYAGEGGAAGLEVGLGAASEERSIRISDRTLLRRPYRAVLLPPSSDADVSWPDYVGDYRSDELNCSYSVRQVDGSLSMTGPRGVRLELRSAGGDWFVADATDYVYPLRLTVDFQRDELGHVATLTLSSSEVTRLRLFRVSDASGGLT